MRIASPAGDYRTNFVRQILETNDYDLYAKSENYFFQVECSDGQIGFGRRRRAISNGPNGLFEITITSFIKVDYEDGAENFEELIKNQTRIYNNKKLIVGNQMTDNKRFYKTLDNERSLEMKEEHSYTNIVADSSGSSLFVSPAIIGLLILPRLWMWN